MRLVETDSEDSDDRSDILEMRPPSNVDGDRVGNNHTEEYWKSDQGTGLKGKADWVEERLNRGHTASESFTVLNELVVVTPPPPRATS